MAQLNRPDEAMNLARRPAGGVMSVFGSPKQNTLPSRLRTQLCMSPIASCTGS